MSLVLRAFSCESLAQTLSSVPLPSLMLLLLSVLLLLPQRLFWAPMHSHGYSNQPYPKAYNLACSLLPSNPSPKFLGAGAGK